MTKESIKTIKSLSLIGTCAAAMGLATGCAGLQQQQGVRIVDLAGNGQPSMGGTTKVQIVGLAQPTTQVQPTVAQTPAPAPQPTVDPAQVQVSAPAPTPAPAPQPTNEPEPAGYLRVSNGQEIPYYIGRTAEGQACPFYIGRDAQGKEEVHPFVFTTDAMGNKTGIRELNTNETAQSQQAQQQGFWSQLAAGTVSVVKTVDNVAGTVANSGVMQLVDKGLNITNTITGIRQVDATNRQTKKLSNSINNVGSILQQLNQNSK